MTIASFKWILSNSKVHPITFTFGTTQNNLKFSEETRAWGAQVAEETYEKKGEIITVDDLDMYVVGDGPNGKTS